MPTHRRKPKTEKEAWGMVFSGWRFLLTTRIETITDIVKKGIYWPLTFYMLFGGSIFAYNYFTVDKFEIKEFGNNTTEFSLMPQAYAAPQDGTRVQIGKQSVRIETYPYDSYITKGFEYIVIVPKGSDKGIGISIPPDQRKELMSRFLEKR
jgi:hypothetical protein